MHQIIFIFKRVIMAQVAALVFTTFMVTAAPVLAAPQILGVIASNQVVPMLCDTGVCAAELSTICLQRKRDDPAPGTVYQFDRPGSATLIVTAADGKTSEFPAGDFVEVTSKRLYTAANVTLDMGTLKNLGGVKASLYIASQVSLVPGAVAGDPDPISQQERQYVTQSMRALADRWVGVTQDKAVAAVIVNQLINATPSKGRMDKVARRTIWDRTIANSNELLNSGQNKAAEILDACQFRVKVGRYFSLRSCLEVKNDSLISDINTRYWKGTEAGS